MTRQGKARLRSFAGTMNADILTGFMKRLTKDAKRQVFAILANLRVDHTRVVKAWLAEYKDKIEVLYLTPCSPPCSPELKPGEDMSCNLKAGVHGRLQSEAKVS